jgi:hypothetical protein
MKLIKLTHANHRTVMYVPETQVAGFYTSPGHACTHIVAPGGAILPVLESVDDVKARLESGSKEEPSHGQ